jgi:hypothetical protein
MQPFGASSGDSTKSVGESRYRSRIAYFVSTKRLIFSTKDMANRFHEVVALSYTYCCLSSFVHFVSSLLQWVST